MALNSGPIAEQATALINRKCLLGQMKLVAIEYFFRLRNKLNSHWFARLMNAAKEIPNGLQIMAELKFHWKTLHRGDAESPQQPAIFYQFRPVFLVTQSTQVFILISTCSTGMSFRGLEDS